MNKKQLEAIKTHGENLKKIFNLDPSTDPIKLCKSLRHIETKISRLSVAYCNDHSKHLELENAIKQAKKRLSEIFPPSPALDAVFINRDPRGYALKLHDDFARNVQIYRDAGGYGILAPEL